MKYLTFGPEKTEYKICILVNDIRKDEIERVYIDPYGLNKDDIIIISLHQTPGKKKTPKAEMVQYINEHLVSIFNNMKIEYLIIGDTDYFKTITKCTNADRMSGYVIQSEYGPQKCVYVPNYRSIFYDPEKVSHKIKLGISALVSYMYGIYTDPGINIIKFCDYPKTVAEIQGWLQKLLEWDRPLTCDIEGFSLKHFNAGIGTITFCWSETEGIAFPVDYNQSDNPEFGTKVRELLRQFFINFKNKLIYHSISFDVTVLIYQLFMDHLLDTKGLLYGMNVMLKNWDDTKLISYLATNSCSGNKLSLKDQAQEYAGNYAVEDIKDIRKIPLDELLQYNLVDGLSTWFVHKKNYPCMVADNQLNIYNTIFKPSILDIIQMQLTGMPLNMKKVKKAREVCEKDQNAALDILNNSYFIKKFVYELNEAWVIKRNSELKVKRVTIADGKEEFNPNSGPQLIKLLYEDLNLPIIDKTDTGLPATGGETLEKLVNHTSDQGIKDFLKALIDYKAVEKILSSFIPAFEAAEQGPDGWHYLFGNFNLGGTVSGRLSSNDPNLQNLPATGSKYAKLIKECFEAPPGWLFCGIDFNSLEDRISALTTKDPNKIKVYTDGYDGHSLRAYAYFGDQMPDIDPNSVTSINSIQKKYKSLRQDSKIPTFSLTYAGTYITIMNSQGWSKEKAQKVENSYHELYKVSDEWVKQRLDQACIDGYVTCAFGLRVRTPLLAQVVRGNQKTPFAAEAEGRTAGNALGQSWCLLNNRAGSEFMGTVRAGSYQYDIRPCAQIHDAQYYIIRDDINVVKYANDNLIKAVQWQNDPEIAHPDVKLGGEFSIFYPNWASEINIPNNASNDDISLSIKKHFDKLAEEAEKKKAA